MDNQFAADFGVTERWRSKRLNRRCIFCVYSKRFNDKVQNIFTWNCLCKDKSIIPGIPRPFCSCFHIDKKACAEIDKVLYDGYTPSEAKKETSNTNNLIQITSNGG